MSDPEAHQRALTAARAAAEGKAEDLVLLDVGGLTLLADYFLICSGTSERHVRALAERIDETCGEAGVRLLHSEGKDEARWVLLDFGDVVVHIFEPETREHYRLAELWADAPRVELGAAA